VWVRLVDGKCTVGAARVWSVAVLSYINIL